MIARILLKKSRIAIFFGRPCKKIFEKVLFDNNCWINFWAAKKDPDRLWELMLTIIKDSTDRICPLRNVTIREDQYPWIDKVLRQKLRDKDRMYRKAKLSGLREDWEFLRHKSDTRKL